jgi:hypothetical protein
MSIRKFLTVALILAAGAGSTAQAADTDGIGLRGWGPRVGLSDGPDQVIGGLHFDLGEFTRNVRLQPSFELGLGDDTLTLAGNLMVAYYFRQVEGRFTPYAGAEITAAYFDFDDDDGPGPGNRDDDVEIGPAAVGGFETRLRGGTRLLGELQVGLRDVPDVRIVVGWIF